MYRTPPSSMVNTRSSAKKLEEKQKNAVVDKALSEPKKEPLSFVPVHPEPLPGTSKAVDQIKTQCDKSITVEAGSASVKEKMDGGVSQKSHRSNRYSQASRSTCSSIRARRKQLELEAANAKARIQMSLIDKKLAADLAQLEEYSSQSEASEIRTHKHVEKWLDRSQKELEMEAQLVPPMENVTDKLHPPAAPRTPPARDGTQDTVHLLATALKDIAAVSATNGPNAGMLSRLCTPRDLPSFSGDPMEWLQFKQAYDESTQVCNFNSKENLWRLRKCLHGQAKEAVTALLIGATSPDIVISTLELQFGNPDIIISKIVHSVNKLPPMSQEYHKDIVPFSIKVKNFVAAVTAIGHDEYLRGMNITSIILSKLPTVLVSKWVDYSYPLINEGMKPRLVILSEFLNEEAIKTSKTAVVLANNYSDTKRKQSDFHSRSQTVLVQNELSAEKCKYCYVSKHDLPDCKKFKKSLRKDRWAFVKRHGLCYKCLVSRHNKELCPAAACDKDNCGQAHHRMLHYIPHSNQQSSVNITEVTDNDASEKQSETVTHINATSGKVLLKTVAINIHGPNGIIRATALCDDGSTVSLISADLAARAGLHGNKQTMRVSGAWNNTELVCESEVVDLKVSNSDGQMFALRARSVAQLDLPIHNASNVNLTNYNLKDYIKNQLCNVPYEKPQLLIGQDHYHLILPLQIIKGSTCEPYVTQTPLGWCIHGRVPAPYDKHMQNSTLFVMTDDLQTENERALLEIHEEVRRSFAIESMGISSKPRQNSEDLRAQEHLEKSAKLVDGRWNVELPWKDVNCKMTESYGNALSRLRGVERKIKKDEGYASRYTERVNHLFENDYAKEVLDPKQTPKTWYLPHFGVDNLNKKKLRLVFDCAAKSNGICLNDYLYKGPDLLVSLYGIMLRFREKRIAISGDIRDMYLRIKIGPESQDALRFLWRPAPEDPEGPENPVKTYAMTSLIFGANCSPFISQFIKNKNAERYESSMPAAVAAICKQHYVDDYIDSFEDEETAIRVVNQVSHIHKQGGFEIRNWTSNSEAVLDSLPKESLGPTAIRFKIDQQNDGERTLGLVWYPKEDLLGFDVSFKRIPEAIISGQKKPTKREMLRVVMSIFDVYGFLSPITIRGKIIIQDTWKQGIHWDDTITDNVHKKWIEFLELLKGLSTVRLPRYYQAATRASETENAPNAPDSSGRRPGTYTNLQLHIMCDASSQALCAVAYWRWLDNNNNRWRLAFISSKCRVAPVKHTSIPRLELESALMAARMANTIINEHKIKPENVYYWSDSSTVLFWVYNHARTYKAFVAHRLGEIDELTHSNQWKYVPTKMNVADIATRDTCDLTVLENEWFYGPAFLYGDEDSWPSNKYLPTPTAVDLEYAMTVQTSAAAAPANLPAVPEPERFSSWLRLLRATSTMLLFINKCKRLTCAGITVELMEQAERLLIKYSQARSFPEDLENLKNKRKLDRKSRLLTLSPMLDEHGILRIEGRIGAALDVLPETKQPVILDGRDHVARLIVRHHHVRAAHGNQEMVVNNLKQKYWVIRIRPTVKHISSTCMLCRIRKAHPLPPRMGNLPLARVAHHQRAFTYCGIDLYGPIEVTVLRRREKRWCVLFTCLTSRAIYTEIVTRLTADALIMALRRMAARRGWPRHIYSDNGTNLKGANNELKKTVSEVDQDVLRDLAVNYNTTWHFIPPISPHWGGAWERQIRTVKAALKVVLKETAPRDEVLSTLMAEVEQIVNSRPLTHVTVEPRTDESLTPNHFLLNGPSNLPVLGSFDHSDLFLRKQWRISQRLADIFWQRWVREVLPQMVPRQKWHQDQRPLQVGDLVLIVDPALPRCIWPKGLIQEVIPGKDGRIRIVHVKTKSGILRRSAARVAYIPTGDEC